MEIDPRTPQEQASEILLVIVNDYTLNNDVISTRKLSPNAAFIKYTNIIMRVNARYASQFDQQFTIEGMAEALILLNDHYND